MELLNRTRVKSSRYFRTNPNQQLYFSRAVILADEILQGAKVEDLAIEGPDHFELVISLKVADSLGLKIPKSLLLLADEVIR